MSKALSGVGGVLRCGCTLGLPGEQKPTGDPVPLPALPAPTLTWPPGRAGRRGEGCPCHLPLIQEGLPSAQWPWSHVLDRLPEMMHINASPNLGRGCGAPGSPRPEVKISQPSSYPKANGKERKSSRGWRALRHLGQRWRRGPCPCEQSKTQRRSGRVGSVPVLTHSWIREAREPPFPVSSLLFLSCAIIWEQKLKGNSPRKGKTQSCRRRTRSRSAASRPDHPCAARPTGVCSSSDTGPPLPPAAKAPLVPPSPLATLGCSGQACCPEPRTGTQSFRVSGQGTRAASPGPAGSSAREEVSTTPGLW